MAFLVFGWMLYQSNGNVGTRRQDELEVEAALRRAAHMHNMHAMQEQQHLHEQQARGMHGQHH
jgi:hypothetical protein